MSDQAADGRSQNEFWSVDSAPRKFAGRVEQSRAPKLLLVFSLLAALMLWLVNAGPLAPFLPHGDFTLAPAEGTHAIPMRIFILSYLLAFGLLCEPSWRLKLAVMADMGLTFVLFCGGIDASAMLFDLALDTRLSLHVVEIASGLIGFAVFGFKLLERGHMPARIDMAIDTKGTRKMILRLLGTAAIAAAIAIWVSAMDLQIVHDLRTLTLLGGIGPGVFLFLPVFFLLLYAIARLDQFLLPKADFAPPLTIIVPAHNEEYIIESTIQAMDAAAGKYDGDVIILIMNNNSEDNTKELATQTLQNCKNATGRVIDELKAGKSNALNSGLDAVETEYFVRVDADTLIRPNAIRLAMRYFADPKVGVVGGLPVPPFGAMFDRARFLEVVVKHGFYSVAMGAINAVVGIPGMLAIYKTDLPRQLGGFVEGMNGEDSDISLRIGELGYTLVVDPAVKYVSEVPASYHHMREQRMRWFRSTFHLSARCRDMLWGPHFTVRGKLILPYMIINSARRAMMVPLILFGFLCLWLPFGAGDMLAWQAVVAVMVGAPTIMAAFSSLINGSVKGLLYIPEYLIFRVLRGYFTLESMLSISIRPFGEHIYSTTALARPRPEHNRIA